jgi:hypothetical protein
MAREDALVANAGDRQQLARATKIEKVAGQQDRQDFTVVVSTKEGRRWVWRMLGVCRVFESVYHPSALIHYQAGQQDIGHRIQGEMVRDHSEMYFLMIKENSNA